MTALRPAERECPSCGAGTPRATKRNRIWRSGCHCHGRRGRVRNGDPATRDDAISPVAIGAAAREAVSGPATEAGGATQ